MRQIQHPLLNTHVQHQQIQQNHRIQYFDIGYQGDLFLFSIEETQTGYDINIPYIPPAEKKKENRTEIFNPNITFEDSKSTKIIVRIDSDNASTPKNPFSSNLKELLDNAKTI